MRSQHAIPPDLAKEKADNQIGMQLAINALRKNGFIDIQPIPLDRKLSYGHLVATKGAQKYVIHVLTRNRIDSTGKENPRYILVHPRHVKDLYGPRARVLHWYGAIPAWVTVTLDSSPRGTICSIYFGTIEQLNGKRGIFMRPQNLERYLCLAIDASVADMLGCDVLTIIPMEEEFQEFCNCLQVKRLTECGEGYYYSVKRLNSEYRVWGIMIGERTATPAAIATGNGMSYARPRLIVLLGIAGRLDTGLRLGDVAVANRVVCYENYNKAVQKRAGFALRRYRADLTPTESLSELALHFPQSDKPLMADWQKQVCRYRDQLRLTDTQLRLTNATPLMRVGPVASGNIVVKSTAFAKELLEMDPDLLAVEMEAIGVAQACGRRQDYVIIRGISDYANGAKSRLDKTTKGAFRRLAMRSATLFFRSVLHSPDFRRLYPLDVEE